MKPRVPVSPLKLLRQLKTGVAVFVLAPRLLAQAPLVNIEGILVGDPQNEADVTGYGSVAYEYIIGKHEVTIAQYTTFLNAVARTDNFGIYNEAMAADGIQRQGAAGSYVYSATGDTNRPITNVSWFNAARFCNWLHNGATADAITGNGAYTIDGPLIGNTFARNAGARFWIPDENEWYKAAYYRGGDTVAGYRKYPTPLATVTTAVAVPPGTPNSANFMNLRTPADRLTPVGAYTTSASSYGTFDQAGNACEWTEGADGGSRILRGGAWNSNGTDSCSKFDRLGSPPESVSANNGFRVACATRPEMQVDYFGVVYDPVRTDKWIEGMPNNGKAIAFGFVDISVLRYEIITKLNIDNPRAFRIRNTGTGAIRAVVISKTGPEAAEFTVNPPPTDMVAPGSSVEFSVQFVPRSDASGKPVPGSREAQISIAAEGIPDSPFLINARADVYDSKTDTDGDGMTDGIEWLLNGSSFDPFAASQDGTTFRFFSAAPIYYYPIINSAGWVAPLDLESAKQQAREEGRRLGRADVTSNPRAYGLYDRTQLNVETTAAFNSGTQSVIGNPLRYGLVPRTELPAARLLLPRDTPFSIIWSGTTSRYVVKGKPDSWNATVNSGTLNLNGTATRAKMSVTPFSGGKPGPEIKLEFGTTR